jgi:4'-phosphopantetheinyl transferase
MTTPADRALLEEVGADLETRAAVVLATVLPEVLDAGTVETLRAPLDDADRRRHSEIQTGRGAAAFLITRAVLRTVLGHLLDRPGTQVEIITSERGKPSLAEGANPPLHFNTSHSRTQALVALSRVGEIGVDVEDIGRVDERVVRRSLSNEEYERLAVMNSEDRTKAFFRLWTVKEACAKATGVGIGIGMRIVAATLEDSGRWGEFKWESIDAGPRVAAAVAVRSAEHVEGRGPVALHSGVLSALFRVDP